MNEQWKQLKETIIEIRDNNKFVHEDVSSICKFLVNYMNILEKQMTNSENPNKWIPVSERLPEESLNSVIGWDSYRERCVFVQYIDGYFQIMGSDECFDIVAWLPLPKVYKEEKENE